MLATLAPNLTTRTIVLASQSPRRKEIMLKLGIPFQVVVSNFEENLNKSDFANAGEYVLANARLKALTVWKRLTDDKQPVDLVIGCDTVVVGSTAMGPNGIIEKPTDSEHAVKILQSLSGVTHEVVSGVVLVSGTEASDCVQLVETTRVTFGALSDAMIRAYVDTGEPMDKAGAYGIQGCGGVLVSGIEGDYYNVMGLPLHRLTQQLLAFDRKLASEK